jgi:glycosyltransferase involved in cell wall biosynthesis
VRQAVVVEHSFGNPGSGGPIMTLQRILDSALADKYTFLRMHQHSAASGINMKMIGDWTAWLRRIKPDLVHIRGLGNEGFHGAMAARLAGCPRILLSIHGTVRDLTNARRSVRLRVLTDIVEPCTLRLATHIATVCESASSRDFLSSYQSKVVGVIPNGVALADPARPMRSRVRRELGIGDERTVLVAVGRLSVEKGHLILAQALKELRDKVQEMTLVLVGDGPDRLAIESAYRGVEGLSFYSLGQRSDVGEILDASDVFVFPTLHENLSNALLEAMAAGLPVIASAVGGNVEVLERGSGILVPVSSPSALADALIRLHSEPALRLSYGVKARSVIAGQYTAAHMVNELDRIYMSILTDGEPR